MTPAQQLANAYVNSFAHHLTAALFHGLLPVLTITLIIYILLKILRPEPEFSGIGGLFAIVGATVGILLGSSREPAVQAIVPALITVITGYLGWTLRQEAQGNATVMRGFMAKPKPNTEPDIRLVTSLVIAAVAALMLSTATGTFWGSSMREAREESQRRYDEWLLNYREQEVPLRTEILRRQLGLPAPAKP